MITRNTRRDETTVLYSPTTNSISEVHVNPTRATSGSTSNPRDLSTILTTQRIEDHTAHKTTTTVQRRITDNTADLLATTRSLGKNREIIYIYVVCT